MTSTERVKEFTVQDVIDAIAADGLDHLRGQWINAYDGKIHGGCVLAQGAFNLSVVPTEDRGTLPQEVMKSSGLKTNFGYHATKPIQNSLIKQLNRFKVRADSKWLSTDVSDKPKCGDTIVYWNDKKSYNLRGEVEYNLPTYEEVAQMVKDVLEPHKDKVVRLRVVDYGGWLAPKEPVTV
jgi:hypothetical protein